MVVEDSAKDSVDFFRVTDCWIERVTGDRVDLILDFHGISAGSVNVGVDSGTFVLIEVMVAEQKPLYFLPGTETLSTDPTFGQHGFDPISEKPALVIDVDASWSTQKKAGTLALMLENRSVVSLAISDPALAAAWILEIHNHDVTFDGQQLQAPRDIGTNAGA